ncbi:hypothetical protein F4054_22840 [Candidatus Poribacteria bacterium]|nr:hypothetical protein [Candidatus Poribacteria bacterium]MYG06047.1 hypothetical protein [Candidatus Poribacteria bacterium]MYK25089.1 hypothetical protein [Candidatus Poribacteria bacterium]
MSLLKKHRIVIGIGITVLTIGMFIFLKNNGMPPEPVVIYKATEPAPRKTQKNVDKPANHTHSHNTTTHTHTPEASPREDSYDWRDDDGFDSLRTKTDPWKQIYVSDDPAPAPTLESTEDPKLRAKYLYDILLNQFGDIPEVHTIGEYEHNTARGIPTTLDEYITFLEAHMSLWPNNTTLSTLEEMRRVKADGVQVIFKRRPQ